MKQVAQLKNKAGIVSLHFIPEKMELIVGCQSGEVFFWDCLKGKQICNYLCYTRYVKTILIKRIAWNNPLSVQLKNINHCSKRSTNKILLTS